MDIEQLSKELKRVQRSMDAFLRVKAPKIIGVLAQNHYRANFSAGGFVDESLEPWPATKRQVSGGKSADNRYGPLLSSRKHLMKSTRHEPSDYKVRIFNDVEYAPIHNDGGMVHPAVTDKMRRYAWQRYFDAIGRKQGGTKYTRKHRRRRKKMDYASMAPNREAMMWKGLALTKKQKLDIKIPRRRFIGPSAALNKKIYARLTTELNKIVSG